MQIDLNQTQLKHIDLTLEMNQNKTSLEKLQITLQISADPVIVLLIMH